MGLDVYASLAYGFEVKTEDFAEVIDVEENPDFREDVPKGLDDMYGDHRADDRRGRCYWVLPDTQKRLLNLRGDGDSVHELTPDMHDPVTLKIYDSLISDAMRDAGLGDVPYKTAWFIITDISY